jgi:Pyridoxamine 5'-phosphate oxidase
MRNWADFEAAAPELAALGRERIEQFGFVFLGTVRGDGGPRVNPVEAHLVGPELALVLIRGTLKVFDLRRDPRAFVHTPVLEPQLGTPGEFKLRASAVAIDEPSLRRQVAETWEREGGYRPPPDWEYFALDVESAAFHRYDEARNVHQLLRWTPGRGLERSTRRYL